LYGGGLELINRQALHCRSLAFVHPIHNHELTFEVLVANDMLEILK
jgi:23S rRNA pseudouridine1911/1915/1917 synthase